jgi:hypothetical protein
MTWLVWVLVAVVIAVAGFAGVAVPRWRDRDVRRRTAWSVQSTEDRMATQVVGQLDAPHLHFLRRQVHGEPRSPSFPR